MYIQVEKNQQSGNYEVTPNVTPVGGVRVYAYDSGDGYLFFSSKQILDVGDTLRGNYYEGISLDTELTVQAVLTHAEYWTAIGDEDDRFKEDARIYLINDENPSSRYSYVGRTADYISTSAPDYYDL